MSRQLALERQFGRAFERYAAQLEVGDGRARWHVVVAEHPVVATDIGPAEHLLEVLEAGEGQGVAAMVDHRGEWVHIRRDEVLEGDRVRVEVIKVEPAGGCEALQVCPEALTFWINGMQSGQRVLDAILA